MERYETELTGKEPAVQEYETLDCRGTIVNHISEVISPGEKSRIA